MDGTETQPAESSQGTETQPAESSQGTETQPAQSSQGTETQSSQGTETQPAESSEGIAETPRPPYVAVIFTSVQAADLEGYSEMAARMEALAAQQPGYLGFESARTPAGVGLAVSYWATEEDAGAWKRVALHAEAQRVGKERWYTAYRVRVARVEREYGHP